MSNKQEMLKMQTCVLRVNIQCHCDGCKKKIRKLLQKIDGVYSTQVNAEQGRVTVTGNVDPAKLIKTLEKSGKHAELWGPQKGSNNNYQNLLNNFNNVQMDVGKGGGKDKSQKGGGKGQPQGQHPQQQHMQFKGPANMKMMPNKLDQKSAKFSAPVDDFDASDEEFGDDLEDDEEEFDDDYENDDEEFGGHGHHGHNMPNKMMPMKGNSGHMPQGYQNGPGFGAGHNMPNKMMPMKGNSGHMPQGYQNGPGFGAGHNMPNKMMPMKGNSGHMPQGYQNGPGFGAGHNMPNMMMPTKGNSGHMPHGPFGMMNGPGFSDKKGGGGGGGGNVKRGGGGAIEIPVVMKGKGGKNDGKNGSGGKKGKSGQVKEGKDGKNGPGKGGKDKKKDGKDKSGGKSGGLLGFLKRSKSGREIVSDEYDCDNYDILLGGGGKNNGNGAKKGGGKGQGVHDINKMKQGFGEFDGHGGPRNIGQMGKMQMGQMGKMGPAGPMGSYGRAVQGLPAQHPMNGGYYQGMGPGNHPYSQQQQQQYMAMMMNQQRQNGNDMYQPMMYARPHPAVNYMPPPMPPPPVADPLTHIFSDENTDSCSIM